MRIATLRKGILIDIAQQATGSGTPNFIIDGRNFIKSHTSDSDIPILSDPDKVQDDDFSLITIVANCVDKWIQTQPEWRFRSYSVSWDDVKRYVQSKRMELE